MLDVHVKHYVMCCVSKIFELDHFLKFISRNKVNFKILIVYNIEGFHNK